MKRLRLPIIEDVPVLVGRLAEAVVDVMAAVVERLLAPLEPEARWRRAIAYAIVGDLVASPLPEPLDVPIDAVVQERLRELVPNIDKYMRISSRIAENMPLLELLPTYLVNVLAARREEEQR